MTNESISKYSFLFLGVTYLTSQLACGADSSSELNHNLEQNSGLASVSVDLAKHNSSKSLNVPSQVPLTNIASRATEDRLATGSSGTCPADGWRALVDGNQTNGCAAHARDNPGPAPYAEIRTQLGWLDATHRKRQLIAISNVKVVFRTHMMTLQPPAARAQLHAILYRETEDGNQIVKTASESIASNPNGNTEVTLNLAADGGSPSYGTWLEVTVRQADENLGHDTTVVLNELEIMGRVPNNVAGKALEDLQAHVHQHSTRMCFGQPNWRAFVDGKVETDCQEFAELFAPTQSVSLKSQLGFIVKPHRADQSVLFYGAVLFASVGPDTLGPMATVRVLDAQGKIVREVSPNFSSLDAPLPFFVAAVDLRGPDGLPTPGTWLQTEIRGGGLCDPRQVGCGHNASVSLGELEIDADLPPPLKPFLTVSGSGDNRMWGVGEVGQSLQSTAADTVYAVDICADPKALPTTARLIDGAGLKGALHTQAEGPPVLLADEGLCAGRFDDPMVWTRFILAQSITLDPSKVVTVSFNAEDRWGYAHAPSYLNGDSYPQGQYYGPSHPNGWTDSDLLIRLVH